MTHPHRAWLVDLDGTLYHPLPVKLAMAAELLVGGLLGQGAALGVVRAFRRQHEALRADPAAPPGNPYAAQLERAADACGRPVEEVAAVVEEWMQRRPGPWLRRFRRRALLAEIAAFRDGGGHTALVSDYPASRKLDALGVRELFDVVVANGEPGGPARLKPSPDGFLAAAERLGVAPDDCLVLGDRDDADGEAARRAAMAFRRVG